MNHFLLAVVMFWGAAAIVFLVRVALACRQQENTTVSREPSGFEVSFEAAADENVRAFVVFASKDEKRFVAVKWIDPVAGFHPYKVWFQVAHPKGRTWFYIQELRYTGEEAKTGAIEVK